MLHTFTSTVWPAYRYVRAGVRTGARIVEHAVMPTERATSPLERYVMTLEEVPPGQVPTRMTPIASSGLRLKTFVRTKARSGITVNCAMQPMMTSFGRLNTTLKALGFSVRKVSICRI